jgi:pimeloyl-ACP methyl ester carboxylesterase
MRKGYADGPFGQIHWRATGEGPDPDLICLHPAPFSGVAFTQIMPHLAQNRRVFAPDYPGHGGSDPFRHDPSIANYAAAISALIEQVSGGGPADLMGFHTGCLIAAEMSVAYQDKVRRIALIDVPAYPQEERAALQADSAMPFEIGPDMACLALAWERGISRRVDSQGMDRSWEMFVETLRHGRGMNAAFHAGFSYDVEGRFGAVGHDALVLASQSMLLEPSRRAAKLIRTAQLVERLDITRAVLDEAATITAAEVLGFLNA